jgi:hypothetical protein|tara:strand:+ start:162 stop:455 length:294 start_codon:yes stop_codon:yes gene_type:complete
MVEDILKLKQMLLNPKRSDEFDTWYYLDGWRMCSVKVGNKRGTITPKFGRGKITIGMRQLKDELNGLYWYAARCHASKEAKLEGRNKRKRQWENQYC